MKSHRQPPKPDYGGLFFFALFCLTVGLAALYVKFSI